MPPLRALLALAVLLLPLGPARAEPRLFRIEPAASELTFRATSRLATADGRFHRFQGHVRVDSARPTSAEIAVTVEVASIDTANRRRDDHLRSDDFFDVARFPLIRFESARVEGQGSRLVVVGRLTVRDVTREVTVPIEVEIAETTLLARGHFELRRKEYGITYQSFLNPVADVVQVAFSFRARTTP